LRFCLALVDVDRFKSVNDELGHLYGDEVLVHLSQIMNRSFRYYDLVCRYGGEEFAILLRDVDLAQAMEVLERFRVTVENYHFPQVGNKTVSIGVVQVEPGEIMPAIIDKADKALYYSKTHGRNQMHAYEKLVASGELAPRESKSGDVELF
ncbi:MAG: GGDEF domain-containing protein, partial [Gammaproteobacteria bacterium]|nr:GGDEF domain-containing protein [Gammaproteobacteria bacterium]